MASKDPVIIFGPTGRVGSATVRAAHEHGAKVFLAMRDTEKAIPGFNSDQEKECGFERVYADLMKPETIEEAVAKTGAKRAFIYLMFMAQDHMRSSITALKSAGIEFVVFLSSYTVPEDLTSLSPDNINFIALAHGKVESVLQEVYGPAGYVAVRPGTFATNSLRWKDMFKNGDIKTPYPEALFDWISDEDIGRVSGSVLARGPAVIQENNGKNWILLYGPDVISQGDAIETIGRVIGKDARITRLDEEGAVEFYTTTSHLPEPLARKMAALLKERAELGKSDGLEGPKYQEAVANIQKYGGKAPTGFKQWVEENKDEFEA
ncbi:hypothetical protein EDD36DRAFT_415318 [Exophiala viscosa]|uniref:NmrA-like domain-containing protein n=1 Tax=Exophiala viscosa TaxID=2486360 RepID=A0AAN6E311_9EURO|nr:hypothetical protein EDD36DRAFT_415318 [Exophiala viscosa]